MAAEYSSGRLVSTSRNPSASSSMQRKARARSASSTSSRPAQNSATRPVRSSSTAALRAAVSIGSQARVVPGERGRGPVQQGGGAGVPAAECQPHRNRLPQLCASVFEDVDEQQKHRGGLARPWPTEHHDALGPGPSVRLVELPT